MQYKSTKINCIFYLSNYNSIKDAQWYGYLGCQGHLFVYFLKPAIAAALSGGWQIKNYLLCISSTPVQFSETPLLKYFKALAIKNFAVWSSESMVTIF